MKLTIIEIIKRIDSKQYVLNYEYDMNKSIMVAKYSRENV